MGKAETERQHLHQEALSSALSGRGLSTTKGSSKAKPITENSFDIDYPRHRNGVKTLLGVVATVRGVSTLTQNLIYSIIIKKLIEIAFGTSLVSNSAFYRALFLDDVSFLTVAFTSLFVALVSSVSNCAMEMLRRVHAVTVSNDLRMGILNSLQSIERAGGDSVAIASSLVLKIERVEEYIKNHGWQVWAWNTTAATAVVVVFAFVWFAGLIALSIFAVATVFRFKMFRKRLRRAAGRIDASGAVLNARLLDVVKNSARVTMMNNVSVERSTLEEIVSLSEPDRAMYNRYSSIQLCVYTYLVSSAPTVISFVMYHIVSEVSTEKALDLGFSFLVAIILMREFFTATLQLRFLGELKDEADHALADVLHFIDQNKKVKEDKHQTESHPFHDQCDEENLLEDHSATIAEGDYIGLENVTFRYPSAGDTRPPVLSAVSIRFSVGHIHVLMGESGSGKSTLLKLLARLVFPTGGRVRSIGADGHGVAGFPRVAYLTQDQHLFARTIRENVVYGGGKELMKDDEKIWSALKRAQIDDWVRTLPDGLEAVLVDGENEISGGQLQRLAIAHLFLTGVDADLVLLDEVLSAVDQNTREVLINEIRVFLMGKTGIIITHHKEFCEIGDFVQQMPKGSV